MHPKAILFLLVDPWKGENSTISRAPTVAAFSAIFLSYWEHLITAADLTGWLVHCARAATVAADWVLADFIDGLKAAALTGQVVDLAAAATVRVDWYVYAIILITHNFIGQLKFLAGNIS